jgi:hypothetical protein
MISRIILIILALSLAGKSTCQEDKEHLFQTDTLQVNKKIQVLGLPVVFYTPETSFGGGVDYNCFSTTSVVSIMQGSQIFSPR